MASGETFSPRERAEIERAVRIAGEVSGLTFSTYVGHVDGDLRSFAAQAHAALPDPARSVMVLVDPTARRMEILTGRDAGRVLSDDACRLVVLAMQSAFAVGDLVGGIVTGLQQLGEHARRPRTAHLDES